MVAIQKFMQSYEYVFYELSDPRTKSFWLVTGPGPLLTILVTYLYFCIKAGPNYMKDKKPYNLKYVVMVYNAFQIIMSITITYLGLNYVFTEQYTDRCYSIDFSDNPRAVWWTKGVALFFYAKISELIDTVFFVLRKKDGQITFLHLYHHTIMPIIGWIGLKYAAAGASHVVLNFGLVLRMASMAEGFESVLYSGQAVPEGSINAFIHVVMYTYYLIAGLGPQYQKYLWWKKYLTTMQLVQFCIIAFLNINSLLSPNCNYPRYLSTLVLCNCVAFFYMFGKFYYNSYVKNRNDKIRISNMQKQAKSN